MVSATIILRVAIFSRPTCFESYNSNAMKTQVYYSIITTLLDKQDTCTNFGISAPQVLLPNNVQSNHTLYDAVLHVTRPVYKHVSIVHYCTR